MHFREENALHTDEIPYSDFLEGEKRIHIFDLAFSRMQRRYTRRGGLSGFGMAVGQQCHEFAPESPAHDDFGPTVSSWEHTLR